MNKQLSFEELLDRMQHIDPNGEWTGSEYTKDVLEAAVSATLYWLQENHTDKYIEYLFEQASRLYGAYTDKMFVDEVHDMLGNIDVYALSDDKLHELYRTIKLITE